MDSYSVKAVLSAVDNGFTSTFAKANNTAKGFGNSLGSTLRSGVLLGAGMKALDMAIGAVTSSMGGAIARFDTLNNFPKIMNNFGISAKDSEKAIQELSDGITGLPTTLDSAASGVQRFVSSNGDINKSTKYFLAMNDAIVAGGQNAGIQASAVEQLSQAYSKGKMDMIEWRSIQQAMPGQLNQIAKTMGMTTAELGEGLRSGNIAMDDFMDTIVKLDKEGGKGIRSFADQAKDATGGIQTGITNVKTAVVRGVANAMSAIDKQLEAGGLPKMGEMINMFGKQVSNVFNNVNDVISKVDFAGAAKAAKPYWNGFTKAVSVAGKYIKKFGTWAGENAGIITKIAIPLAGVVTAFKGLKVVTGLVGPLLNINGVFTKLATGVLMRLAPQLFATGAAEEAAGAGATVAAPPLLSMGAAILMVGGGLALACLGLALLAQSAIALGAAGAPAIAVMFGMVAAIGAMAGVVALLGPALDVAAPGVLAFGAAVMLIGTGVLEASAGLLLMSKAMPVLAATTLTAATGLVALAGAMVAMATSSATAIAAAAGMATIATGCLAVGKASGYCAKNMNKLATASKQSAAGVVMLRTGLTLLKSGAVTEAAQAINQLSNKLKTGIPRAQNLGANLSKGFARGMHSQLSAITREANQIVKQAERVIRAKAKIKSPSRLTKKLGAYFTEGFAIGISSGAKGVANATARMISIPNADMAAAGYSGGLNESYMYGGGDTVLYINGREFARATGADMQNELTSRTKLANRKIGRV